MNITYRTLQALVGKFGCKQIFALGLKYFADRKLMSGFKSNYNKHHIDVGLYSFKDSAEYIICFTELSAHTNQFCVN